MPPPNGVPAAGSRRIIQKIRGRRSVSPVKDLLSDGTGVSPSASSLGQALFGGSRQTSSLPPLRMSPYMFYHGEPIDADDDDGAQESGADVDKSASKKKAAAKEDPLPPNSPFRTGNLETALLVSLSDFTEGAANGTLDAVKMRLYHHRRTREAAVSSHALPEPTHSNLLPLHRILSTLVIRDAGTMFASQSFGSHGASSSSLSPVRRRVSSTMFSTNVYARALGEVRISSIIAMLRDTYAISNKPLLEAFSDLLYRCNDRLEEGKPLSTVGGSGDSGSLLLSNSNNASNGDLALKSPVGESASLVAAAAASPGCIPFSALMDLIDLYVNGPMISADTRAACFQCFDATNQRVITIKQLRALRGCKDQQIRARTNGGTFAMLKALLDLFHDENSNLAETLTKEQLTPLFDVDDGALVQGFMEEILRQMVQKEVGVSRSTLL